MTSCSGIAHPTGCASPATCAFPLSRVLPYGLRSRVGIQCRPLPYLYPPFPSGRDEGSYNTILFSFESSFENPGRKETDRANARREDTFARCVFAGTRLPRKLTFPSNAGGGPMGEFGDGGIWCTRSWRRGPRDGLRRGIHGDGS